MVLVATLVLGWWTLHPRYTHGGYAPRSAVLSRLQTLRGEIELFRLTTGDHPASVTTGAGWDALVSGGQLPDSPGNHLRNRATGIVVGDRGPGMASDGAASDGWYWSTAGAILYAIDVDGRVFGF